MEHTLELCGKDNLEARIRSVSRRNRRVSVLELSLALVLKMPKKMGIFLLLRAS